MNLSNLMSNVKVPPSLNKFLTNKFVLYFVSFIALMNVLGYLMMGNVYNVAVFIMFSLFTKLFSSNMTVILGVAILLTNLLSATDVYDTVSVTEGMTTDVDSANPKEEEKTANKIKEVLEKHVAQKSNQIVVPHHEEEHNLEEHHDEAFEVGVSNAKKRSKIDYASTIEDAYDELNKIIGGDGIKRLTDDTQHLMKQQLQLAEAMKNMTPIMEQAKSMIEGMDIQNLGNIADLAKKFTSAK